MPKSPSWSYEEDSLTFDSCYILKFDSTLYKTYIKTMQHANLKNRTGSYKRYNTNHAFCFKLEVIEFGSTTAGTHSAHIRVDIWHSKASIAWIYNRLVEKQWMAVHLNEFVRGRSWHTQCIQMCSQPPKKCSSLMRGKVINFWNKYCKGAKNICSVWLQRAFYPYTRSQIKNCLPDTCIQFCSMAPFFLFLWQGGQNVETRNSLEYEGINYFPP